jgi:demethylmenaquinone methyltransferase/2-methoxy-6-polyprenyl-1,4-benzoquinol methylase
MAKAPEGRPTRGEDKPRQVREMFSRIAPRYDLLNRILSFNVDRGWRRKAVDALAWRNWPSGLFLDACSGTFDLSLELALKYGFDGRVVAADFAHPMLREGREKIRGTGVHPVCGDTLQLPFRDGTFNGAMVAFGVRNLADIGRGLGELVRVLRPGGRLVILEFTEPPNRLFRSFYLFYFRRVLPLIGRFLSGHPWAYDYLPESVRDFPDPPGLARMMEGAGLEEARWALLTGGIAALHVGVRPGVGAEGPLPPRAGPPPESRGGGRTARDHPGSG